MSRLIDAIIPDDLRYCVFGYLDSLCVVSDSFENHVEVASLTLNETKSKFCARQVNYLGYTILSLLAHKFVIGQHQRIYVSTEYF